MGAIDIAMSLGYINVIKLFTMLSDQDSITIKNKKNYK